jgi:serine/threonine protein kinase
MITRREPMKSTCPDQGLFEKLLMEADGNQAEAFATLDEHLQSCDLCRRVFDGLMNDEQTDSWRRIATELPDRTLAYPVKPSQTIVPFGRGPLEHYLTPSDSENGLGEIGSYQILRQLGNGSMGFVYLAEDRQLSTLRALKLPRIEFIDNAVANERFLREARLAAQVRHPNVVAILAVTQVAPCPLPILVME